MLFHAKVIGQLVQRINAPVRKDNRAGMLAKDSVIAVEKICYGEAIEGNNKWFMDTNGFYYWSGGTDMANDYDPNANPNETVIDYNKMISNIPTEWRATRGKGVTVAILDTGMASGKEQLFGNRIVARHNSVEENTPGNDTNVEDGAENIHGTRVASIIAADPGMEPTGIRGVAPDVHLVIVKITETRDNVQPEPVLAGLQWVLDNYTNKTRPDFLNMSFDVASTNNANEFANKLSRILGLGTCILAAGANNENLATTDYIYYPACFPGIIGVGTLDQKSAAVEILSNHHFENNMRYVIPNINYVVPAVTDPYYVASGKTCSFATALLTGVLALGCAYGSASLLSDVDSFAHKIKPSFYTNKPEIYSL